MRQIKSYLVTSLITLISAAIPTLTFAGTTADQLLKEYEAEAKKDNAAFAGFSADKGHEFYKAERKNKKGETVSCTSCHTPDPAKEGKTRAGKVVEPMALSVNKKRFTDKAKVEKWFKRNCQDVYERPCTAQEKGDFISFLKTR